MDIFFLLHQKHNNTDPHSAAGGRPRPPTPPTPPYKTNTHDEPRARQYGTQPGLLQKFQLRMSWVWCTSEGSYPARANPLLPVDAVKPM